jgi:hypothetical protein
MNDEGQPGHESGGDELELTVRLPAPLPDDDATVRHAAPSVTRVCPPARGAPASGRTPHPLAASQLALAPGFGLFEYRIDAVLGQGGFGITYLATDVNLNAPVAIKEYLPADYAQRASDKSVSPRWPEDRDAYQGGLDSFLEEARTLASFPPSEHRARGALFRGQPYRLHGAGIRARQAAQGLVARTRRHG